MVDSSLLHLSAGLILDSVQSILLGIWSNYLDQMDIVDLSLVMGNS